MVYTVLVLIYYYKKHFKPCFFYFKDILHPFKFVNWRIRFLMSRTGYTFGIYFTQSSHNTGCQKLGIVLENKLLMYFQN